jgi:cobalamin-dependent methionine synthase I
MAAPQDSGGLGISGSTGNDQRFTSRDQGKRYSFGYPACSDLEGQAGLWKLLKPEEIAVQLREGFIRSNKQADATITG